jgi:DnaJ-domain-containing protein 1
MSTGPFGLLGLPARFDLPDQAVESAFLARLGAVHPDLAGEDAAHDAAALTEARATLADPEKRASALLACLGGPGASDDRSLPDGFLMDIMKLRETAEADLAEDGDARARWGDLAAQRRAAHIERVAALFAELPDPPPLERLAEIRLELNAWRYTERLIEQLDPGYDPADADFAG